MKLWNRGDFKNLKYEGSVPKIIGVIKEEVYGLRLNEYPLYLYLWACLKLYSHTQGKDVRGITIDDHVQSHDDLVDVARNAGGYFSGMKGLADLK